MSEDGRSGVATWTAIIGLSALWVGGMAYLASDAKKRGALDGIVKRKRSRARRRSRQ